MWDNILQSLPASFNLSGGRANENTPNGAKAASAVLLLLLLLLPIGTAVAPMARWARDVTFAALGAEFGATSSECRREGGRNSAAQRDWAR